MCVCVCVSNRCPVVELLEVWSHEISHTHSLGDPIVYQLLHSLYREINNMVM